MRYKTGLFENGPLRNRVLTYKGLKVCVIILVRIGVEFHFIENLFKVRVLKLIWTNNESKYSRLV